MNLLELQLIFSLKINSKTVKTAFCRKFWTPSISNHLYALVHACMQAIMQASNQPWCILSLDIGLFCIVPLPLQSTLKRFPEITCTAEKHRKIVVDFRVFFGYLVIAKTWYFAKELAVSRRCRLKNPPFKKVCGQRATTT